MNATVECYAGAGYPERPRALLMDGERFGVVQVEHRARTPRGVHFRVRLDDGRRFLLRYHEAQDAWRVRELGAR